MPATVWLVSPEFSRALQTYFLLGSSLIPAKRTLWMEDEGFAFRVIHVTDQ